MPVRNEAESLVPALLALGAQRDLLGRSLPEGDVLVLLLLNGCTDTSWDCLQSLRGEHVPNWIAIDGELPDALRHAGGARRVALTKALALSTSDTALIATTDADSVVSPTWVARQLAWMRSGCDVILGVVDVSIVDMHAWPLELVRRHRQERSYARWLSRIDAWLDPCDYHPWPRHGVPSGASLGFRPAALRAALPLPAPACGEDRALIQRCHGLDMKVQGDPQLRITTSGRLHGRACGGMADTLMHWIGNPGAPCDAMLEPVDRAVVRARWRARLRERHRQAQLSASWLSCALAISQAQAEHMASLPTFGLLWQACERFSPRLTQVSLSPAALNQEIQVAIGWLSARAADIDAAACPESTPTMLEIPA